MKKITAIFLFCIMMLCSSGFYIAFYLSLQSIKHTQRQIILSSELKDKYVFEFAFSKDGPTKHEGFSFVEKDEIRYKGKMYDIVTQYSTRDSIFIKCIADEHEDYTRALAGNEALKTQNAKNEKCLLLLKFSLDNLVFNSGNGLSKFFFITEPATHTIFRPGNLLHPIINIPSPPPWC